MRVPTRWVALLAAALLTVLVAGTGQSALARPPVRPGKATNLEIVVTKPGFAYRLDTSWTAARNATSYQVRITNTTGTVLDSDTVTQPGWVAFVRAPALTTVRLTVVPYNGSRKGRASSLSKVLPDLTPPTGTFEIARSGQTATITQTSLSDDVSPPSAIKRVVDWGDGNSENWTTGTTITHDYAGDGLWRPTVTISDERGNSAVIHLRAVVIGDNAAPTGSFAVSPSRAWVKLTSVSVTQMTLHDDFSDNAHIVRSVIWGDGNVSPWPSGLVIRHTYLVTGQFTPQVELTDDAGNTARVAASPSVAVSRDTTPPTVSLTLPTFNRTFARSWRTIRGRAIDEGTGVRIVRVKAIEKRHGVWYSYRPVSGTWTRSGTVRRFAWPRAGLIRVVPGAEGRWHVYLRHLTKGRLGYRVNARDNALNTSKPVYHFQRVSRF